VDDVARDEVPRTRCVVKARDNEVQPVALFAVISNQMLGAFGSPRVGVAQRGQQKGFSQRMWARSRATSSSASARSAEIGIRSPSIISFTKPSICSTSRRSRS
jgi:hypothetical protein